MRSGLSLASNPASGMPSQGTRWPRGRLIPILGRVRTRRRLSAAALAAAAALLLASAHASAQTSAGPEAQADAYLAQARGALQAESGESARSLIGTALALAPDYSEALYMRAIVDAGDRARTRAVRQDLASAVASARWKQTDPDEALLALGEVLLRTSALAEAQPLIEKLSRERTDDHRCLLLLGRLREKQGTAALAQRVFADGILRFPSVDRFPLLLARSLAKSGKASAAKAAVAAALKELPDSLPLLLRAAELETQPAARLRAVELYLSKGGGDPLAPLLALEAKPKESDKYLGFVIERGGLARVDIAERAWRAAAGKKSLVATLTEALARYSGFRDLDADGDGFYEERWELSAGAVARWVRDRDQDGVAELAADFQQGSPAALTVELDAGSPLTYRYSRYPSLDSVSEPSRELTRTMLLVPYALAAPFLEAGRAAAAPGMVPRPVPRPTLPTRQRLAESAWRLEERSVGVGEAPAAGALVRSVDSVKGTTTYVAEDLDGDGKVDHRIWYENGSPVRGERDMAADGVFEAKEIWQDGRLWKSAVDTDGSGVADYSEVFAAGTVRLWDYDEDGKDDSRASDGPGGAEIREFSTSLDGVFDLTVVFRADRIAEVRRSGRPVPVSVSTERGLTWIGSPGKGVGLDAATPDGFHSLGGKRYLVFRHAGAVYAEELE